MPFNRSIVASLLAASSLAFLGACSDSKKQKQAAKPPAPEEKKETIAPSGNEPEVAGAGTPEPGEEKTAKAELPLPRTEDPEKKEPPRVPGFPDKFTKPDQLTKTIADKLAAGKSADVFQFLGPEITGTPRALGFKWALTDGGYVIDPETPMQDVGEMGVLHRQALRLVAKRESGEVDREKVYLDLRRDAKSGWRVESLSSSPTLRAKALEAGLPEPLPELADDDPDDGKPAEEGLRGMAPGADTGDALTNADTFLTAVLEQDYATAVKLCDPDRVPEEKIAALCIVFEEGAYRMKAQKPLMATAVGELQTAAWIIAHVQSEKIGAQSDFGIEMSHDKKDGWKITGLNFSEMLARFAAASEAGKVPYTPLVKSPKGGESLVVYFEYDDAGITQRAQRQIEILSSILRSDPDKRLRVSGHADALGTAEYNEKLSLDRAKTVKKLLAGLGVPADQIVTEAAGENAPLRPNTLPDGTDDPTGRSHNRRAELFLDF